MALKCDRGGGGDGRRLARRSPSEPVSVTLPMCCHNRPTGCPSLGLQKNCILFRQQRCLSMGTWCTYILSNYPKAPIYICEVPSAKGLPSCRRSQRALVRPRGPLRQAAHLYYCGRPARAACEQPGSFPSRHTTHSRVQRPPHLYTPPGRPADLCYVCNGGLRPSQYTKVHDDYTDTPP